MTGPAGTGHDGAARSELLTPGPALALGALLDVPVPDLDRDGLPLLWHWIYLLDRPAQADLGPDGHPVRGTVAVPPGPGQRRMWAGGQVRAAGPLRCGQPATRRSQVLGVRQKLGRSGPLTFVTVGHQIWQHGRLVIDEHQDLVYRAPATVPQPPPADAPLASPAGSAEPADGPLVPPAAGERAIEVSPTLLFRFSALTYNAHRVHYDRDYARDVEGYPGLLTHGPLQALAMAEAARAAGFTSGGFFRYRLIAPLFDHQGMIVKAVRQGHAVDLAVRDLHARQTATATLAS